MAADSAMREGSLPVSWGVKLVPFSIIGCLSLTLLFSDPARSTRFILPVNAEIEFRRWKPEKQMDVLILATGSTMLASIVKMAWEREEARLRLVAPTERCLVAALICSHS